MISMDMKKFFFDRRLVMKAVDDGTRKALGGFGRIVRKEARASIKETRIPTTHSRPGSPPLSHMAAARRALNKRRKAAGQSRISGGFTGLKYILYVYDPAKRSVIIGPASNRKRPLTIPEILEQGKLDVARRPFMGPAFAKAKTQLPALWAGSVKKP